MFGELAPPYPTDDLHYRPYPHAFQRGTHLVHKLSTRRALYGRDANPRGRCLQLTQQSLRQPENCTNSRICPWQSSPKQEKHADDLEHEFGTFSRRHRGVAITVPAPVFTTDLGSFAEIRLPELHQLLKLADLSTNTASALCKCFDSSRRVRSLRS